VTKPQSLALAGWFAIGVAGLLCAPSPAKAPAPSLLFTDRGVLVRALPPIPHPVPIAGPPAPIAGATLAAIMLAVSRRRG
jgi:hypothetical protein